ncbi:hypothetical protein [Clostridium aciditolerans]|uniref:Uncharacterized protein n=1 Tax=Clostridium aciditolerans TaxID=339861 RepID=A0A934HS16_9CLOT|nr:hypothetical protein [Clostridium aciditolerans]MBI6873441.1 hypothetical protein [Clostridium aciditolerans]
MIRYGKVRFFILISLLIKLDNVYNRKLRTEGKKLLIDYSGIFQIAINLDITEITFENNCEM